MQQTWVEKKIQRCIRKGKNNKYWKPLMMVELICLIFLQRVFRTIMQSQKKIIGIGTCVLVFFVSSSFAMPVLEKNSELQAEQVVENVSNIEWEEVNLEDLVEYSYEGDADSYTVDEILAKTASYQNASAGVNSGEQTVFSVKDWNLILVNKQHPIPEEYTFTLGTITGTMKCDERIIPELLEMLQGAKNEGINLIVRSPYRDLSRQEFLFDRKLSTYMRQGYSYLESYRLASQIVMIPGASEHQLGLALDITSDTYSGLQQGFGKTTAGKWMADHSYEYGFIVRYPSHKEAITGVEYEPWHFRYVGKAAAKEIWERNICLEEFVDSLSE